ncbi:MAG TPA: YceH family protein [Acidimicrobiales bacterium]|jgi:hypothetical protein|nr:YceH family protein [Acidimicrobiales bacterium]
MKLDPDEGRVVGSLIEKQLTTPQQYPLSLNALTLACNQTSNRDPVVSYSEAEVQSALDSLKEKGLARFVLPSHGRSVVRFRHVMDERLALDNRQLALIAVLLLRGPQTVGELRTRTERMADFASIEEVESDLEGLTRWEDPYVARLPRRPGQKEERWAHLFFEAPEPTDTGGEPRRGGGAIDELRAEVAALRDEVGTLRQEIGRLRDALGE